MSVSCASPALDTLLVIDDLVVDRDAALWGSEIVPLQLVRIGSSMEIKSLCAATRKQPEKEADLPLGPD